MCHFYLSEDLKGIYNSGKLGLDGRGLVIYIYIYVYIYLTAIGLLPGCSVYKRTYIQQGNHTYISRHHTAQHKYYNGHKQVQKQQY
jgi:hypothetical protein